MQVPSSPFAKLLTIYSLWLAGWMLSASLFEVYFFGIGLSTHGIYLSNVMWFAAGTILIPFLRGFRTRDFILAGLIVAVLSVALLFSFPDPAIAPLYRLLVGVTHVLFWMPFNVLFYEFRKENNNALLGALYYSISPVLSLFLPGIAGALAASMGFPTLFVAGFGVFAAGFVLAASWVENKRYEFDFRECIESLSGLRSLIFLEGFAAMVMMSITLEVMLLLFVDTPLEYGGFMSLATAFSVAAALVAASQSDRMRNRRAFLLPVAAMFALSAILSSQAGDVVTFFLGTGLMMFFARIFFPLPLALTVDNSKSLVSGMVGREWLLNVGRLAGGIFGFALFTFTDIRTVLFAQGIILLLYIPLFESRKRKLERH